MKIRTQIEITAVQMLSLIKPAKVFSWARISIEPCLCSAMSQFLPVVFPRALADSRGAVTGGEAQEQHADDRGCDRAALAAISAQAP